MRSVSLERAGIREGRRGFVAKRRELRCICVANVVIARCWDGTVRGGSRLENKKYNKGYLDGAIR